jgi:hypothetical protein
MFFMQIFFAGVLGLASLGSIAFVLINNHLHDRDPQMEYPEGE